MNYLYKRGRREEVKNGGLRKIIIIILNVGFRRVDSKVFIGEPEGYVLLDFIYARGGCDGMREKNIVSISKDYLSHW